MTASKQKLVVIGNGMAGMKTVETLLEHSRDQFEITVFGAEPHGNYNRIMLSPVLCGEKTIDEIMINDCQWYRDNNITLHAGPDKTIETIDRLHRVVIAKDGSKAQYDRLLIATGSNPFILPVPGHTLKGVLGFRDIFDVQKMLSYCPSTSEPKAHNAKHAVVLGGGLLGLEAANGLVQRGMKVTVVHSRDILLNRQLDHEAANLLQAELAARGVNFDMPAQTQALIGDGATTNSGSVKAVRFADGRELPCDLFIMAIGVRPNIALAQKAGLYCERGIVVSDTLQTYDPAIYAVGECIEHRGDTFGLVAPLFDQAKVCANQLCGHGVGEYKTLPSATKLKVTGIQLFSVGRFNPELGDEILRFSDPELNTYKKLVINNNRLVGTVLYGDTQDGAWYQQLLEDNTNIQSARQALVFGRAYAEPLLHSASTAEASAQKVA